MAKYQNLINSISSVIRTNGNNEITGQILQDVLKSIVNVVGANPTYGGVAHPADNPGTPDGGVVYIASEEGTYVNFGGLTLASNELAVLVWNGTSWSKESVTYIEDLGDIEAAKQEALAAIAEAIQGLNIYYDVEADKGAVKDVQLKDGQGNKLMPITYYDYDVSANNPTAGPNNDGKFESLSALLSDRNLDTLIPTAVRKGGMSIKFVLSSDNKYVQYRLLVTNFTTNVFGWEEYDRITTSNQLRSDLDISDEKGCVLARFKDGHIQTKYFNSKEIQIKTQWYGKKVSIIGDSISTAPSSNAVEFTVLDSDITNNRTLQGYPTYYDVGTTIGTKTIDLSMVGVLTSFTPISGDVGKTIGKPLNYNTEGASGVASYMDTWWYKLSSKLGMEVLQNVSWSGASISSHEGNTDKYKTSYAWHPAQINKLATRDSEGNTIIPDVVIIYRGTNDMTHSPYTSISDFGASAISIPNTDYQDSAYDFKIAYCLTIKKIRETYPQVKIVLCTLNVFKRINYSQFPTNNGTNTLPEYNNAIREVANMMGCGLIDFDKDGITFENCYPTYISDSSTIPTHPNPIGHTAMAEKAKIDIIKF